MAKILTWRDEWTLGINTLDDDHRKIVDLLLEVARRFREDAECLKEPREARDVAGDNGETLYTALGRFGDFTRQHFQREEEFIRTIDYPGLSDHYSEHLLLMAELTNMVRELQERGAAHLGSEDLETLKQWVVAHILGADRKFADYYFRICD